MISMRSNGKILLAAGALLAGALAMAQVPPPPGQNPTNQQPGAPGQAAPNSPETTMPGMTDNSNPQSFADQSFLRKTLEDNAAEVQMGQLAAQKSTSGDVQQFGQKMAQIHEQLTDQMKPLAKQLEVDVPKQPSKKARQEIEKMQALSGPDFDAAFIKAMLKDQQSDLKDFKDEAQGAQNPNVQQLAKMDVPVLSQHLEILQKLAQTHNVTAEEKK